MCFGTGPINNLRFLDHYKVYGDLIFELLPYFCMCLTLTHPYLYTTSSFNIKHFDSHFFHVLLLSQSKGVEQKKMKQEQNETLHTVAIPFLLLVDETEWYCIEQYWKGLFDAY